LNSTMETDYARAFRIIRAPFRLKQSELAARMGISVSQLSLIEAGKRNATDKVTSALAKATKVPTALVDVLASNRHEIGQKAELAGVLLTLLVPETRQTVAPRARKAG
jgi:transcriptional regulator with XRE-family HTH domain